MLKKLLKHEFAATSRYYLPMLAVLAFATLAASLIGLPETYNPLMAIAASLMLMVFVLSVIAVMFGSIAIAVVRFYKNLMTGEGYLTFTLPVTTGSILSAKLITGYLWTLVSWILSFFAVQTVVRIHSGISIIGRLSELIREDSVSEINLLPVLLTMALMVLLSLLYQLLIYYLSITIGQLISTNKILGSVAAYLIISFATGIVSFAAMLAATFAVGIDRLEAVISTTGGMCGIFGAMSLLLAIMSAIFYLVIKKVLGTRLNLE